MVPGRFDRRGSRHPRIEIVEQTAPVQKKQVLTCLKLTMMKRGLLLNFGAPLMKDGISRIVNGLTDPPAT